MNSKFKMKILIKVEFNKTKIQSKMISKYKMNANQLLMRIITIHKA